MLLRLIERCLLETSNHFKRKKILYLKFFLFFLAILPVTYNSCMGPIGNVAQQIELDSSSKVICPELGAGFLAEKNKFANSPPLVKAAFSKNKLDLSPVLLSPNDIQNKSTAPDTPQMLEEGTQLSIVLDPSCANLKIKENNINSMSYKLLDGKTIGINWRRYAINYVLQKRTRTEDLEYEMQQDNCIIGASFTKTYEKFDIQVNDPDYPQQKLLFQALHVEQAWNNFYYGTHSIELNDEKNATKIAIIDTGIDYNHEELKNMIFTPEEEGYGLNATLEEGHPLRFYPLDTSSIGHGTHVAGIIAAEANNNTGIVGLSPLNSKLLPIKVFEKNPNEQPLASNTSIANGIFYSVEHGVDIINLSLGYFESPGLATQDDQMLASSIQYALDNNIVVIAAAGNATEEFPQSELGKNGFNVVPGKYAAGLKGMISVGAFDVMDGKLSNFSHYSSTFVEILAPGSINGNNHGIYSTFNNGDYGSISGTSMAAPMVSAAASLVISWYKTNGISYTAGDIEDVILSAAKKQIALECVVQKGRSLDFTNLYLMARLGNK